MSDHSQDKTTWIKLHRKLLQSGIFNGSLPHVLKVWIWCLLKAYHKPTKKMIGYREVELSPGQFVTGRKAASRELGISEQQVRSCLKSLKSNQQINQQANQHYTIITIVNWHTYQYKPPADNQPINQASNHCVTNNQPTDNQRITTNKNDKNIKNVKNTIHAIKSIHPDTETFGQWWMDTKHTPVSNKWLEYIDTVFASSRIPLAFAQDEAKGLAGTIKPWTLAERLVDAWKHCRQLDETRYKDFAVAPGVKKLLKNIGGGRIKID